MEFRRIEPTGAAAKAVECYWTVTDDDTTPVKQKIIPDGFTEIIFHFGDHYRINLDGQWRKQRNRFLAGQISKFFYLENSGVTNIVGVKLKPPAITHLFGVSMKGIVDKVVDLDKTVKIDLTGDDVDAINDCFSRLSKDYPGDHPVDRAVEIIFSKKGMISVTDVCNELFVGERYLQQLFQKYVGLTPKFFARVVRFSYIFQLIKENSPDWANVVYEAGYYDQSHFIKAVKKLAGVSPKELNRNQNDRFIQFSLLPGK